MEKIMLNGYKNQPFPVYQFEVVNPKAILILVHGVAECAQRYEYVANYLNTHQTLLTLSPYGHPYDYLSNFFVTEYGKIESTLVHNTLGVRPAISLAPGTIVGGGDGSADDPFTVDLDPSI